MSKNNNDQHGLIEWLGFTRKLDFSRARPLGSFIGASLFLFAIILLFTTIIALFNVFSAGLHLGAYAGDVDGSAIRNTGLVLAALLSAPFVVWRSVVAAKLAHIADEALFNDKINSAAKDLTARKEVTRVVTQDGKEVVLKEWNDDLVTRAAAMDRLEGLADERKEAAPRIVRLLAAYVRGHFPRKNLDITEPPFTSKSPRMDMQKAIDTIGRVHKHAVEVDTSRWRIDLKGCDFDGVSFQGGFFWAADFSNCRFELSSLNDANFDGCLFQGSLLNFADFRRSNLTGVRFDRAILNRPVPVVGGFVSSINLGELRGTTFIAADISALSYLGEPDIISKTFATKDTIISENLRDKMLDENQHALAGTVRYLRRNKNLTNQDRENIQRLEGTGFQHWSHNDSTDMATGHLLERFYEELGMKKWPYY